MNCILAMKDMEEAIVGQGEKAVSEVSKAAKYLGNAQDEIVSFLIKVAIKKLLLMDLK